MAALGSCFRRNDGGGIRNDGGGIAPAHGPAAQRELVTVLARALKTLIQQGQHLYRRRAAETGQPGLGQRVMVAYRPNRGAVVNDGPLRIGQCQGQRLSVVTDLVVMHRHLDGCLPAARRDGQRTRCLGIVHACRRGAVGRGIVHRNVHA